MSAPSQNTTSSALVAPARALWPGRGRTRRSGRAPHRWLAVALLAGSLAACGGSDGPSAQTLLNETFHSHKPIESGRISLAFGLASLPTGASAQATSLSLQGPFESLGSGRLPSFALQIGLRSAGPAGAHAFQVGLTSTQGQLFVELGGVSFAAPAATVQALAQGYAHATASSPASRGSTFSLLGVEPGEWLVNPTIVGSAEVAGTETTHIAAGLDIARFVADAQKLTGAGAALGLGSAGPAALLSPAAISALASSVRSAHVDVYTGTQDHVLRRIALTLIVASTPQTRAALGGLSSATLTLTLQFAELGEPQHIPAPSNTQPLSALLPALQHLGLRGAAPRG